MTVDVIVTGAGGQLGRELQITCPANRHILALDRGGLDLSDKMAVSALIERIRPTTVINAAAYTAVDQAESDELGAHRGNVVGPENLASACREFGARLLHVSTDFVFDGEASHPYTPASQPAPIGIYGRTKLDGEHAVIAQLPQAFILRTGWVYSRFGGNFVKTMLRLHSERDQLNVVADQIGTPTWARGLAQALWSAAARPHLRGIYHWSDAGVCSWYDFAIAIGEEAVGLELLAAPARVLPINAVEYPTPASRPAYSVLDKTASWRDLQQDIKHWRAQLREMLMDYKENSDG